MEECKMRQTIMQDFRMLGMLLVAGSAKTGDATTPNGNGSMNPIVGFKEKIAATGTTWNSSYHWTSTELVGGAWSVIFNMINNNASMSFYEDTKTEYDKVLGCLAF